MTKISPLVMICIVAFAMVSSVGFALSSGVTQWIHVALSKCNTEIIGSARASTLISRIFGGGDAINDPKPNTR